MHDIKDDPKKTAILETAFELVNRYGFKRTTMDDIARAVGMSRPALYLHFKNKTDILRAFMLVLIQQMEAESALAFDQNTPALQQVENALDAGIVAPMRRIFGTPHGAELFDLKNELASDLTDTWMRTLEQEIARGMSRLQEAGILDFARCGLTPANVAGLLVDAAEGMKGRTQDPDILQARLQDLVKLTVQPLLR